MRRKTAMLIVLVLIPFTLVKKTADYEWNGPALDWFRSGVGYQIYVPSFCDSDGDGIGDLNGIRSKLDYLNDGKPGGDDLGIDVIWLSPIFESSSLHGYDTIDYFAIHPKFGTMDGFTALVNDAKKRGIRIVLDLVLNHCSDRHPFFMDAKADKNSPKRSWFMFYKENRVWRTWRDTAFSRLGKNDYYWATFDRTMPDWNLSNPDVTAYMYGIADFWLDKGIGGFRLDAVRHLIEVPAQDGSAQTMNTDATLAWLSAFRKHTSRTKPDSVLIGEIWESPETVVRYSDPAEGNITGGFNFGAQEALTKLFSEGADSYASVIERTASQLRTPGRDIPFTSNHDMMRLANAFDSDEQRKAAARVLLMTPGTPFIYYGDELGTEAPSASDAGYRTVMSWKNGPNAGFGTRTAANGLAPGYQTKNVEDELRDPASILNAYRETIALRRSLPEYGIGSFVYIPSEKELLVFAVRTPHRRYLAAVNLSAKPQTIRIAGTAWKKELDFAEDRTVTFREPGKDAAAGSPEPGQVKPWELKVSEIY